MKPWNTKTNLLISGGKWIKKRQDILYLKYWRVFISRKIWPGEILFSMFPKGFCLSAWNLAKFRGKDCSVNNLCTVGKDCSMNNLCTIGRCCLHWTILFTFHWYIYFYLLICVISLEKESQDFPFCVCVCFPNFCILVTLWGMWDLSAPSRDQTCTPCIGCVEP